MHEINKNFGLPGDLVNYLKNFTINGLPVLDCLPHYSSWSRKYYCFCIKDKKFSFVFIATDSTDSDRRWAIFSAT